MRNCELALSKRTICLVAAILLGGRATTGQPEERPEQKIPGTVALAETQSEQPVPKATAIVVRAMPLPSAPRQIGRTVEVIGTGKINETRSASVSDVIEKGTLVQVSERGSGNVQADLSIRGSTFRQVLVALDGLR